MSKHGFAYPRIAGRVAALLLATTALTPLMGGIATPALADGGSGGSSNAGAVTGGAGGTGFNGATGGNGGSNGSEFGGGGGGGAGGGKGGNGGDTSSGGGLGGNAVSKDGQTGSNASPTFGAGGGGGGYNGNGSGTATIDGSSLTGGNGGAGGQGSVFPSGGGGGGAGGYGAIVTGSGTSTVNGGPILGGAGGAGGSSSFGGARGGGGGSGGVGVQFAASGATLSIGSGTVIRGGNGGAGGTSGGEAGNGAPGLGGAGIVGSGLSVIESGTISGGLAGDGVTRANAITFTGGTNRLEIQVPSSITGNVVVSGGTGTLALGGGIDAGFDVSKIGGVGSSAQYQGFGAFEKTGSSTWTLINTTAATTPWTLKSGALSISSNGNLGAAGGTLTFDGGTLQTTATFTLSRSTTLNAGGGTFNVASGTTLTQDSAVSGIGGAGALTKSGAGTLTLTASNGYTGATTVSGGTLALSGGAADISSSSLVTVGTGATFDVSANVVSSIRSIAGSGTVQLGDSDALEITNGSSEFSGVITSTSCSCATLAIGGGTQTLSGVNTYAGPTAIRQGATLALKGAGSIASSDGVEFFPNVSGVGTFDISQTTSGAVIGSLFDLDGVGVVSLGSKTLTVGLGGGQFAGVIQDGGLGGGSGGGLTVSSDPSSGGLQLAGTSTYTGATTVQANSLLAIVGNGSIASSSGVTLVGAGATFDISGVNGGTTIKDLSGGTGTKVALGANALTVGSANSSTFGGVIADGGFYGGTGGSLVKQGSGTLTLTGTNSLAVQAQTTTSLRTIFGADLAGSVPVGSTRTLDLDVRLGWQHEYASTARPITSSFAGAPGFAFTVYGATPATDSAVVGFSAKSQIADNAQLYLRYDGQIGTGTDNHALNVGLRFTW
jgi:autotransporter-associated beta strand protein